MPTLGRESDIKKFWSKANKKPIEKDCWIWGGKIYPGQYGRSVWEGVTTGAHRISWIIKFGPIPKNQFVCHHCDVRSCVNPSHLFLGTNRENILDAKIKGRMNRGESNCNAKLNERTISVIFNLVKKGLTQQAIANHIGISREGAGKVIRGDRWTHLKQFDVLRKIDIRRTARRILR